MSTGRRAGPVRPDLPARRVALLAGLALMATGGCGFTMRQPSRLAFTSLALTGFAPRSPLAEALRREVGTQVPVLPSPERAAVVLHAFEDRRERGVVASTAAAQVREVQLRLRFDFRAHTPAGRELLPRAQLLLTRDMSTREIAQLAKEQEETELFDDMQRDVVAQVMRRLASIRL